MRLWLFGLPATIVGAIALSAVLCRIDPPACESTSFALPAVPLIDVAARGPADVWLLTARGVYHTDRCTWRVHRPFEKLAPGDLDWETIVVDHDNSIVITGVVPAGPSDPGPCMPDGPCCGTPGTPARRVSYRFAGARWEPIEARPPGKPELVVAPTTLGKERTVIATKRVASDHLDLDAQLLFAVVERRRHVDGHTETSHELWQRKHGVWAIVVEPPLE